MKKYCDYYFTTKKMGLGYAWFIRNEKGEVLESSLDEEVGECYYENKKVAEQEAREAIQDHYI
jgi:hypothetical protein